MADYTHTFAFKTDVPGHAATMRGQLYVGGVASGPVISTGFAEVGSLGNYEFTPTLSDTFRGALEITDTADATFSLIVDINPEQLINADVRTSTRPSAAQVRAEMDSSSTQLAAIILLVDTVESSLSTMLSRLTAVRAGYIDNIGGGQIALATDALAIKNKTDNLPAAPAAVGSAMTLADGSISAATILDNAITSAKLAASAIAAIKDGLATATSVADLQTILAKVNALIEPDGVGYRFNTNALELAPTGSGGGGAGTGTGDIRVNHTYGATASDPTPLRFVYGTSTAGVDNGWVRAFLVSDYDLGLRTLKGETRTKADGTWAEDLLLDAAEYYIEFRTPDERKAVLQAVTVVAEA